MRLLVAWFRFTLHGAIGRTINIARTLTRSGVEVRFLSLTGETETEWPDFPSPILTLEEVASGQWDAVMVPGSGVPPEQLIMLRMLKHTCFGDRVQLILNDPTFYDRFAFVNKVMEPHIVIFNNSHWQPKDFRKMSAEAFHILPGAVDTSLFTPPEDRSAPVSPPGWRIGAFASKNPGPLVEAAEMLPETHVLHFYGAIPAQPAEKFAKLAEAGRVINHGALHGKDLADFYRSMDLVVTTELSAGWCNTAAEASACGVPCVVTPHGTIDFAEHEENALVLENPTAEAISDAVQRLMSDTELLRKLGRNAAARMQEFSWETYCDKLVDILRQPRIQSYFRIPEIGLYGKWEPGVRIRGLEPIFNDCNDATLLDLGAAEGIISFIFAQKGVKLVHGFELLADRVEAAKNLLSQATLQAFCFRQANLADPSAFIRNHGDILLDKYDIVLFLGLYHHLPSETRNEILAEALKRCKRWIAVRTSEKLFTDECLTKKIATEGFVLAGEAEASEEENLGLLRIFKKE